MEWILSPVTRELVGFLGWCFCGFVILLVVSFPLKRSTPKPKTRWQKSTEKLDRWQKKIVDKGRAYSLAMPFLLAIGCVSVLVMAAVKSKNVDVTEHNLRIERKVGPNQWWIVSDEHPDGFMYYACSDFENDKWIYAGYYVRVAHWQVRGGCNSIRDQGFEFDYAWKADGHAKTIQEAGYE